MLQITFNTFHCFITYSVSRILASLMFHRCITHVSSVYLSAVIYFIFKTTAMQNMYVYVERALHNISISKASGRGHVCMCNSLVQNFLPNSEDYWTR